MSSAIQSTPLSSSSDPNSLEFFISQFMNKIWTSTIVVVKASSNDGGVSPVGKVTIQPMVTMTDSNGRVIDHSDIYEVPYMRLQGGNDAVIIDPKVGDIGIAMFANRDISAVKSSRKTSPPGSGRKFHASDAFYMGGILNGIPTQFLRYFSGGIEIVSPNKITIIAPEIEHNAATSFTVNSPTITLNGNVSQGEGSNAGDATFGGTITAIGEIKGNGINLSTHKHSGVQVGSGDTELPV